MRMTPRLLGGFVAMPFVAAVVVGAFSYARAANATGRVGATPLQAAIVAGVFAFIFALAIVCLVAGPIFFWWTKARAASIFASLGWGALLGNIPTALGILIFVSGRLSRGESLVGLASFSYSSVVGTTTGLICAAAFWFIAAPVRGQTEPARTPFEV